MKYGTYNAETLRAELDEFEKRYGMSSAGHYEWRYAANRAPMEIGGFDSHVWADTYAEWCRLSRDGQ